MKSESPRVPLWSAIAVIAVLAIAGWYSVHRWGPKTHHENEAAQPKATTLVIEAPRTNLV